MNNTAEELKDTLNDIERDAYDGVDLRDMFTRAYVLADELGESIDKLSEENIKLRELVEYMHRCYVIGHDWGPYGAPEKWWVEEQMRELGIEVQA